MFSQYSTRATLDQWNRARSSVENGIKVTASKKPRWIQVKLRLARSNRPSCVC